MHRLASVLTFVLATAASAAPAKTLYDFEAKRINGARKTAPEKLADYRGKVLLVVNTASECGYTKQYRGLQALRAKYAAEGFEVLGFPSNDFGGQEPGSNAEIRNFCERRFKVDFPLFEKGAVIGKGIQPIYEHLTENAPTKGPIAWNFEKFLVGRDGRIVGRYKSAVAPESDELDGAVRAAIAAPKPATN